MSFEQGYPKYFDVISPCPVFCLMSNPIERHKNLFEVDLTAVLLADSFTIHYLRQQKSFVYEKSRYYCLLDDFSDYYSTDNHDACKKSPYLKSIVCGPSVPARCIRRSVYVAKNLI